MASGSKGRGDVTLGGRHLFGIFVLLVVMMGIVFTLGYVLGRSRSEDQVIAAGQPSERPASTGALNEGTAPVVNTTATRGAVAVEAPSAGWDFYRSDEATKSPEHLESVPESVARPSAPSNAIIQPAAKPLRTEPPKPATEPSANRAPAIAPRNSALIPKGAITLQVAALLRQGDALALAQVLQEKKFPTIVTTPSADKYYRVQVGPYPDSRSATAARKELEKQGFKTMVRR